MFGESTNLVSMLEGRSSSQDPWFHPISGAPTMRAYRQSSLSATVSGQFLPDYDSPHGNLGAEAYFGQRVRPFGAAPAGISQEAWNQAWIENDPYARTDPAGVAQSRRNDLARGRKIVKNERRRRRRGG